MGFLGFVGFVGLGESLTAILTLGHGDLRGTLAVYVWCRFSGSRALNLKS